MTLAQSAADPAVITNYMKMAEHYLVAAEAELKLAIELELLKPTSEATPGE